MLSPKPPCVGRNNSTPQARAQLFRDRQYAIAEALLDTAEEYLARMEECDLDHMRFADACKALEIASRLGQQTVARSEADTAATPARNLRDQLTRLLDQVCPESPSPTSTQVTASSPASPPLPPGNP